MKRNWFFKPWYVFKLRQQSNSPFKMKSEAESIQSDCLSEIQYSITTFWLSIKKIAYRLGVKLIQLNRARLDRRELEPPAFLPNPLFSQNQVARITRKFWIGVLTVPGFLTPESYLNLLISSLFLAGASDLAKLLFAVFLSLVFMLCLNFGFEQHFKFRRLKELAQSGQIPNGTLKRQNDLRILGYVLIAISLISILFCGLARTFFLEHIEPKGLPMDKILSNQKAGKYASLLGMLVTFAAALLLAWVKMDQASIADKYNVLKYWKKTVKRRNAYSQKLIVAGNKLLLSIDEIIETHWCLIIDLKRVYKMSQEYDLKYESLNQEYLELKARPGFTLNETIYRKFAPVQCAHRELFFFGIYNSTVVKDKIAYVNLMLEQLEHFLNEHITAANTSLGSSTVSSHNGSNGSVKKENILSTLK